MECLPVNFVPDDMNTGPIKDRTRVGASLADIRFPCEDFSSGLVNVCTCACSVIHQDDKPLNGMYNIFLYVTWCTRQFQQCFSEFRQWIPNVPRRLLAIPNKAGHSVTTGECMKHWECLCLCWSKPTCYFMGCENACQFQMLARVHTLALDLLPQTQPVPQHLCLQFRSVSCDDHGVHVTACGYQLLRGCKCHLTHKFYV